MKTFYGVNYVAYHLILTWEDVHWLAVRAWYNTSPWPVILSGPAAVREMLK